MNRRDKYQYTAGVPLWLTAGISPWQISTLHSAPARLLVVMTLL